MCFENVLQDFIENINTMQDRGRFESEMLGAREKSGELSAELELTDSC